MDSLKLPTRSFAYYIYNYVLPRIFYTHLGRNILTVSMVESSSLKNNKGEEVDNEDIVLMRKEETEEVKITS